MHEHAVLVTVVANILGRIDLGYGVTKRFVGRMIAEVFTGDSRDCCPYAKASEFVRIIELPSLKFDLLLGSALMRACSIIAYTAHPLS
jgi:hypothetical protein